MIVLLENPGIAARDTAFAMACCTPGVRSRCSPTRICRRPSPKPTSYLRRWRDGADVAIGSRWLKRELQTERQPIHRQLYGRLFNLGLRIVLGLGYRDTQCGFKAFTRRAIQVVFTRQRVERWGFDPELLFLAKKFRLKTVEVPVEWAHDHRSKINPVRDGLRMGLDVLEIRWNDLLGHYKLPSVRFPEAVAIQPSEPARLAK